MFYALWLDSENIPPLTKSGFSPACADLASQDCRIPRSSPTTKSSSPRMEIEALSRADVGLAAGNCTVPVLP
jgi:hypothetical protein